MPRKVLEALQSPVVVPQRPPGKYKKKLSIRAQDWRYMMPKIGTWPDLPPPRS